MYSFIHFINNLLYPVSFRPLFPFFFPQELNAVVEAAGGDANSTQKMEIGTASSPKDTVSTPTTSHSSWEVIVSTPLPLKAPLKAASSPKDAISTPTTSYPS